MKKSGGAVANRTGQSLEDNICEILTDRGYIFIKPNSKFFPMQKMNQSIFSRQYEIGKDIYGKNRRVDIILYHPNLWKNCLVIQCKWQASAGSVEEKYPFEVLNIKQNNYDTIVILDGGGYTKGAKQWLTNQSGKNRLKHIFTQGEFQKFSSKGKLG